MNHVRELALDAIRDERVHLAGGVEPTLREVRMADARVTHELAEMRLDAGRLREADEMCDYGHAATPSGATPRAARREVVGRVGLEPTTNGLRVHCSTN